MIYRGPGSPPLSRPWKSREEERKERGGTEQMKREEREGKLDGKSKGRDREI